MTNEEITETRKEIEFLNKKLKELRKKVKWTVEDTKTAYFLDDAIKSRELFIQFWG